MLLVIIILFIISQLSVVIFKNWNNSKFFMLAEAGMTVILITIYINGAKSGGFSSEQIEVLFGSKFLVDMAKNFVLRLNVLATVFIVARLVVCYAMFLDAAYTNIESRRFLKKRKYMIAVFALPIVLSGVLSLPSMFFGAFANNYALQNFIVASTDVLIWIYLLISVAINVFDHKNIALSWYKKRNRFRLLCEAILLFQYIYLLTYNPVTIFQDSSSVFITLPYIKYINVYSLIRWIPVLSLSIVLMVASIIGFYFYARYDYDREAKEVKIAKEINSATIATTSMVHGLKNQILAAKLLSDDIDYCIKNGETEKVKEISEEYNELNARMLDRINTLYKSFRRVNSVLVVTSVDEIIKLVLAKIKRAVPPGVVEVSCEAKYAMADAELLSEAIANIIVNGYESVPKDRTPKIRLKVYSTRGHLVFTVEDNGNGIPKEVCNKVFSPFVTTKNSANNWGLGLSYSMQIVKNHLGAINFETTVGKGTTFFVVLPKYDIKE